MHRCCTAAVALLASCVSELPYAFPNVCDEEPHYILYAGARGDTAVFTTPLDFFDKDCPIIEPYGYCTDEPNVYLVQCARRVEEWTQTGRFVSVVIYDGETSWTEKLELR